MNNKKGGNFLLLIIAIISGGKVYKHFDFENLKFQKPVLDIIYLIVFVVSIVLFFKGYFEKKDNN